ncbi:LysE family translocator [Bradyrhizobium sp. U531]|uniref:LysE family translocator n=1 Tax=Bradyrhizobium sp. U531 TaxID=3053458 RepID=UPI003F43C690
MFELQSFALFLAAATLVAITPGPGIFYIIARTLAGGRTEGLASSVGLGLGGLVHVLAGAIGISALLMASAEAFTALKIAGAFYLIWLGIKTWRQTLISAPTEVRTTGASRALREGIVVEALNPKTAAFFLAFIPQFVDASANVALQFVVLGTISVALNTSVDLIVTRWAAKARDRLAGRHTFIARTRQTSGAVMCGLGVALLTARRAS